MVGVVVVIDDRPWVFLYFVGNDSSDTKDSVHVFSVSLCVEKKIPRSNVSLRVDVVGSCLLLHNPGSFYCTLKRCVNLEVRKYSAQSCDVGLPT